MAQRILIIGLNWIGDAIMSMPAIQACRAENPDAHIALLVKPYLKPLWEMSGVPDEIHCLDGMASTVKVLRQGHYDNACILPNSFRSALLPTLAGIRRRVGLSGDLRRAMLTRVIPLSGGHQACEYFPILAPSRVGSPCEFPRLKIPDSAFQTLEVKIPTLENYAVLMPGAARGASKMWPIKSFKTLAQKILAETDLSIVFAGGTGDAEACEELAKDLGEKTISVAGKTNLQEWAALLSRAKIAVANDSGGMHLAAAVGAPVVGIYGITDPEKTGPLTKNYRVIQNSNTKARDISRNSDEAQKALESISPDQVFLAVTDLLLGA